MASKSKTSLEALGGAPSLSSSPYRAEEDKKLAQLAQLETVSGSEDSSAEEAKKVNKADTIDQLGASSEEIQSLAKQDLDFLAAIIMPLVFTYCFPPVFKSVWSWLLAYVHQERAFPQLALGLPRGFGKSTLMKIYLIYVILFTDRKFILVVAATAKLAENILSDVIDMLEEPNIRAVFGDWKLGCEKDTQALKKFGFRGRNITLAAAGAETSVRGLNIKNERPDVILMDDIQSRECADSAVQSDSLESWMIGTLMKAKSPTGCMFLFVANMYPTKHSILRKLKSNPSWVKFIAGGILADGTSLWEELQPIAQLTAEFENDLAMGRPEIFYSEVLNDENVQANNLIDLSKLPAVPHEEGDIPAGNFIIIDPATDKLGADEVSVGYFEVHDASPILMEMEEGRFSPGDTIRKALHYALSKNCRLIVVESNAYQYSLLYWFDFICQQMGIQGIECVPIYSGSRAKNARILDMFKAYAAGEIYVHELARLEVHLQITQFNPMKRDNTDGLLDLLTYAPRVIMEFGEYVITGNIIEAQEFDALEVPLFNSGF
ncbi:MAG: hypothetical protein DRJ63_10125 [Thermoprotei archaeon]|nr:MAG: hypothetical protein DRJ63_10125 [Thermoprotei archaeon]